MNRPNVDWGIQISIEYVPKETIYGGKKALDNGSMVLFFFEIGKKHLFCTMFSIPNILTASNLLSGLFSIVFSLSGRLDWAVLAIFIGAVCDFFDGFAARLLNKQGEFGKQLDSLADIVTFGVAPSIMVFVLLIISSAWDLIQTGGGALNNLWLDGTMGYSVSLWVGVYLNDLVGNEHPDYPMMFSGWNLIYPLFAFFIAFMSLFRLAKFNLDERQSTGFIGIPTPANTLFFAAFALMLWDGFGAEDWRTALSMTLIKDQVLLFFVVLFSLLLVAELPLFSLKFTSFSWKENQLRIIFLGISAILISTLFVWALPLIILLYIGMSLGKYSMRSSS
ncbi:MAG: CDP-alcohol phosphatidyltransferase family protein [Crocinitomicaceae bacterium]|nr:CDP-alcohol phosphatidyltransferase family protein [Crocinitomicaceae bacterium]